MGHFGNLSKLLCWGTKMSILLDHVLSFRVVSTRFNGGSLPVLSLMTPETYGGSLEKTVHFKPTSARDVTSGVCQSEPQCALPDPVNGPCVNNATCDDLWNASNVPMLARFQRRFLRGTFISQFLRLFCNGHICQTNIDDCVGNECSSNGTCVDGIQKYMCACTKGYGGQYCETEINECESNPCQNAGTCADFDWPIRVHV